MRLKLLITGVIFILFTVTTACNKQKTYNYPKAKKVNQTDNYHGTQVADPYRWLEDVNSKDTKKWVEAEKQFTDNYLSKIPFRSAIEKRYTKLWNYEKYSAPRKVGKYYIFSKNDGLQEQSVVYIQKGLEGEPEVLLNPNNFSKDGTVSLAGIFFSKDHKFLSYGISKGGSDWREFKVMEVETKKELNDLIKWGKFTGNAWYKNGFFYSRYDAPKEGETLKQKNEFQKLYYHKIGTKQSEDKLVYEDKSNPKRGFSAYVTDDEKYLIISVWEGSSSKNLLYYKDLTKRNGKIVKLIDKSESIYDFIGENNNKFILHTNNNAPNFKIVEVDLKKPEKENWKVLIPETKNKIDSVSFVGNKLIVSFLKDANTSVSVFDLNGEKQFDVKLPGIGTAYGFSGSKEDTETFFTFTSFTFPPTIYKYNIENNTSTLFRKSAVDFNPEDYETKEVFYNSKDGTIIPLFIVHKKGLKLDKNRPTLLYAYGGFNISLKPSFRLTMIPLLENNGVYAMACLRGGGEYGEEWHKAGMLDKKQNVFDDFIAAQEYLINNNYTSKEKLAIMGGSNGGLLIGAVINQRPDLCKVAFPMVGVLDMLRFHKFTIGWAWVSEYGSSDNEKDFKWLYKYSPLHNIKEGVNYPATLVLTADHDDRVFPAHSFKYVATLQEKYKGPNPVLIRIETKAGHGAGTSTTKYIKEYTDIMSFLFYNMGITPTFNN